MWIAVSRIAAGIVIGHAVVALFPQALQHTRLGTLSNGTWLEVFDRWDARYYTTIAAHGYPAHAPDVQAFFPGYPLVVRAAHDLTGGALTYAQTASLVSFAAFVGSAGLLYRLVARRFDTQAALVSTVLFCWFPTSVFFLAPYSEALFALEILIVATLLDRGWWWWAALVAGYASATSPESVALTGALVVAALFARRGFRRTIGYGLVGSFGAAAFVLYLGIRFGKPLAFFDALPTFHRMAVAPFAGVVENVGSIDHALHQVGATDANLRPFADNIIWMWLVDDAAVVLAVGALVTLLVMAIKEPRVSKAPGGRQVPVAWIAVLAGIVILASTTIVRTPGGPASTEAAARLVGVAFPLSVGSYLMVRRWPAPVIIGLGLSITAAVLTQIMFNLGYWVT